MKEIKMKTENSMEKKTKKAATAKRLTMLMCSVMLMALCWGNMVFATNYAENFVTGTFLSNLKWAAIAVIIFLCLMSIVKRNYTSLVITLIVGAVILFFIVNPMKLEDIGGTIGGSIFG